jgi:hypothetical protein
VTTPKKDDSSYDIAKVRVDDNGLRFTGLAGGIGHRNIHASGHDVFGSRPMVWRLSSKHLFSMGLLVLTTIMWRLGDGF